MFTMRFTKVISED